MSDDKKRFSGKGGPKGGSRSDFGKTSDFRKKTGKPAPSGAARPFRSDGEKRQEGRPKFSSPKRDGGSPYKPKAKPFKPRESHSSASSSGGVGSPTERIAKRLARAGVASRRDAEALIEAGRISVNGEVLTSPAVNVAPDDRIAIDGEPIPAIERTRLFLFHKPAGVVTTNRDPEGRRTVFDALPKDLPRLMTIGRLDINTEGLLLLTNDGGLARVLELPATGWLRRYRVRVHGKVDQAALDGLKDGIAVDGIFYGAIEAALEREQGSNAWLTLALREGKNREVKNVLGALGLEVTRLIRVSYGPFQLGELPEGAVVELKGRTLRDQLGQRLIAEAGADFDAPIVNPFSNKPVASEKDKEAPKRDESPRREERPRKPRPDERREKALERLSTRPDHGGRGRGEKPERRDEPRRSRSSNVWMAPGARPLSKKKEEEAAAAASERDRGGERTYRKRPEGRGKPGKGFGGKPRGERDENRASAERAPRPGRREREGAAAKRPEGAARGKPVGSGRPRPSSGDRQGPRPDRPPRGKAPGKGPRKP